jgi:hypothetical protein
LPDEEQERFESAAAGYEATGFYRMEKVYFGPASIAKVHFCYFNFKIGQTSLLTFETVQI